MKKRLIFSLVFLLFIGLYLVNAAITAMNPGHNSEQIYIQLSNKYVNLQRAIDSPSLQSISSYDNLPTTTPYHLADQILITKDSYKMTLKEAIETRAFIDGPQQGYAYKTTLPAGGEYATSINVSTDIGTMNLQEAINLGKLSHIWVCVSNLGEPCSLLGDASCVNPGTIQCDGSCSATYKPKGTACTADDWHSCDGEGSCLGWSGYGCGCPFGIIQFGCCPGGASSCATGWVCGACNNLGIYQGLPDYHTGGWAYSSPICAVGKPSQGIYLPNNWMMKP